MALSAGSHPPLEALGLRPGEQVRFRRTDRHRWQAGKVVRRERDGSIGIVDGRGAACAIPVERIEVRAEGPRGGAGWEPLPDRARRVEQMRLL